MSYRGDHDAALARVAALEKALERERSDDAAREEKLAELERELASARGQLAEAEAELSRLRPKAKKSTHDRNRNRRRIYNYVLLGLGILLVVIPLVALVTSGGEGSSSDPSSSSDPGPVRADPPAKPPTVAAPDQIQAYLEEALARGPKELQNSRLIGIRGSGITREGGLHPEYGQVEFLFVAANPKPRPVNTRPIGAPEPAQDWEPYVCLTLDRRHRGWRNHEWLSRRCVLWGEPAELAKRPTLALKCTMKAIWNRAIADGAPKEAIAKISNLSTRQVRSIISDKVTALKGWDFDIDDKRAPFHKSYDDDCIPPR